jgi:hypothetical protein
MYGIETDILLWENIHPGFRYMDAVKNLHNNLDAIPNSIADSYYEATKAYGTYYELAKAVREKWVDEEKPFRYRLSDYDKSFLYKHKKENIYQHICKSFFVEAIELRNKYPTIYFRVNDHGLPESARTAYSSITRPVLLEHPNGIFIPHGGGRSEFPGTIFIESSFLVNVLHDIAEEGELRSSIRFARKVLKSFPSYGKEAFVDQLDRALGKAGIPFLTAFKEAV